MYILIIVILVITYLDPTLTIRCLIHFITDLFVLILTRLITKAEVEPMFSESSEETAL